MDFGNSDKEDFTCPICMYILIHPVTMPCAHSLCMPCYKQCVEKSKLSCPLCRMRISSWARKHSRTNTLVDQKKWDAVQRAFPSQVKNRLEDRESSDDEWESWQQLATELRKQKEISQPGAIREEYETALAQLRKQQEEEKKKEEEASEALIKAMQEEEERELALFEQQREENEKRGIEAALQLEKAESSISHRTASSCTASSSSSSVKNTHKAKRSTSSSIKLNVFYETIRRSSSSAPLTSERAEAPTRPRHPLTGRGQESSPYPYICLSPSDKLDPNPSPSDCSTPEWSASLDSHLTEHSYTSASARRIDLTSESQSYMAYRRGDVMASQPVIKLEPLETCSEGSPTSFQPIESFMQTPPKKFPSGTTVEPAVIKATPRKLTFDGSMPSTSKTSDIDGRATAIQPSHEHYPHNCQAFSPRLNAPRSSNESHMVCVNGAGDNKLALDTKAVRKVIGKHNVSESVSLCTSSSSSSSSRKGENVRDGRQITREVVTGDENDDEFITEDSPLVIPLEPDLNVNKTYSSEFNASSLPHSCRSTEIGQRMNERMDGKSTSHNTPKKANVLSEQNRWSSSSKTKHSPQLKANPTKSKKESKASSAHSSSSSSKSRKAHAPSTMSIRQFCTPAGVSHKSSPSSSSRKRKLGPDDTAVICQISQQENGSDEDDDVAVTAITQEDADYLFALQLQNMYSKLDKHAISVDRYKGSKDEYLFRKRKCL